ncbi:protrudin-like [Liolophura sinensis]|uniref:protrudin-like n=1 Tax=Liolophura sinensis TaxID=3198878 RepID=UPI00315812EB
MAPDECGDGKVSDSPVDIINFVHEVHCFSALVEPIETVWTGITNIRRWRSPYVTLGVWLLCNIGGVLLTKGTVFVLVAFMIFLLSGISLFHVHTRILDKILPNTGTDMEEDQSSGVYTATENMQSIKEFRVSLIQMYVILEDLNQKLIRFYTLLKWDDMKQSLRFHVGISLTMLCLCVLPSRWNFLLFTNWFLLGDEKVHKYLRKNGVDKLQAFIQEKCGLDLLTQSACVKEVKEKNRTFTEKEPSECEEKPGVEGQSDGEYDVGSSESGNDSDSKTEFVPSKPGMVSRLLEFKRRKQQMMTGQCHGCKASFASILKRRYCCMQCGNHFCARCCFQKVPRSVFGATAPAAKTETVPVCGSCYTLLANKEGKVC